MQVIMFILFLFLGLSSSVGAPAAASDLDGLTGWYKTTTDNAPKVYVGVFDLDTCRGMLRVGTPGVCVRLSFTAGAGEWWQVVRSGTSTVLILGHTGTEQACKKQILAGTHTVCIQAQVKEEVAP